MSNVNKIYNNYCFVKFLLKYNKDDKDIVVKLYIFNSDIHLKENINIIELVKTDEETWETSTFIKFNKSYNLEFAYKIHNNLTNFINTEKCNSINRSYNLSFYNNIVIESQFDSNEDKIINLDINNNENNNNNNKNEKKSNFYKPVILTNLEYESNQFLSHDINESYNFYQTPSINNDRIIIATTYVPFEIKKQYITEDNYIYKTIYNESNSIYSILFNRRDWYTCDIKWVGMLKNYKEFNETELYEIQDLLEINNIYIVIPDVNIEFDNYLKYVNNIILPVFVDCSMNMNDNCFIDYEDYFNSYKHINKLFGIKIADIASQNDLIMVNDVHLMLLPNYILSRRINCRVGIYFHKAFPSSDIMKTFPYHSELMKSILLCDVIGFHVFQFARNFLTSCKRILGIFYEIKFKGFITLNYLGRNIIIKIKHGSIDQKFLESVVLKINNNYDNSDINLKDNNVIDNYKQNNKISYPYIKYFKLKNLNEEYMLYYNKYINLLNNKFSLVSIDNFEESSSILLKIESYKRFLILLKDKNISTNNIVLYQVIKNMKYKTLKQNYIKEVNELIHEVKSIFGEESIIIEFVDNFNIAKRYALFMLGSILYYLQIRKGNCLYFVEYMILKYIMINNIIKDETNIINYLDKSNIWLGVILSENIGIPDTLKFSYKINPYNINDITNSIMKCFKIKIAERANKFIFDLKYILNYNTFDWVEDFLIDLKRTKDKEVQRIGIGIGLQFKIMNIKVNFKHLIKQDFVSAYKNSKLKLFFLDYEGTLQTSINNEGEETLKGYKPNSKLLDTLKMLCSIESNIVFIVSGREKEKLEQWFDNVPNLNLASEHGFFICKKSRQLLDKEKNSDEKWSELFKIIDWSWKESVLKILEGFTATTEGSYIYEKESIVTWFYRDCDFYFGNIQANEINTHIFNIFENSKLDIVNGKGYVEIKPKGINKGFFMSSVIKKLYSKNLFPDFIFSIGDDTSDEEMFKYFNSINTQLIYNNPNTKVFSTTIGNKPSSANYFLNDSNQVVEYLESLYKALYNENNSSCYNFNVFNNKSHYNLNSYLQNKDQSSSNNLSYSIRSFNNLRSISVNGSLLENESMHSNLYSNNKAIYQDNTNSDFDNINEFYSDSTGKFCV